MLSPVDLVTNIRPLLFLCFGYTVAAVYNWATTPTASQSTHLDVTEAPIRDLSIDNLE